MKHSNSVELKLTVADSAIRSTADALGMHRLSASVQGRAGRFRDRNRIARCRGVNPVAIQRGLQEHGGLHCSRSSG